MAQGAEGVGGPCGANPNPQPHRPHIGNLQAGPPLVRGLRVRIPKPWVAKSASSARCEPTRDPKWRPTRAPNRSSSVWWGVALLMPGLQLDQVLLAVGHSARDTFAIACTARVWPRSQAFSDRAAETSIPNAMVDQARRGPFAGHPRLAAAEYSLSITAHGRHRTTASACAAGGPWWWPRLRSRSQCGDQRHLSQHFTRMSAMAQQRHRCGTGAQ